MVIYDMAMNATAGIILYLYVAFAAISLGAGSESKGHLDEVIAAAELPTPPFLELVITDYEEPDVERSQRNYPMRL